MDPNKKLDRLDLHEELVNVLGSRNVYFVPDINTSLHYPCIVYQRKKIDVKHANDKPYLLYTRYEVTVISYDPDSDEYEQETKNELNEDMTGASINERLLYHFDHIEYDTHFVNDNLNHDVFTLYY